MKKLILILLMLFSINSFAQIDTANWSIIRNSVDGKYSLLTNRTEIGGVAAGGIIIPIIFTANQIDTSLFQLLPNSSNGKYSIATNRGVLYGIDTGDIRISVMYDMGGVQLSGANTWTGTQTFASTMVTRKIYLVTDSIKVPYNTITEAIDAWSTGKSILLSGGTFTENVILNKDSITFIGSSKENTIIPNLKITGKNCTVKNMTIKDSCLIYNTTANNWWGQGNQIIDCILLGNINIGKADTANFYPITFTNCNFLGNGKAWTIYNDVSSPYIKVNRCFVNGVTDTLTPTFTIYSGGIKFVDCPDLLFKSLALDNANKYAQAAFFNCNIGFLGGITSTGTTAEQQYAVVDFNRSRIYLFPNFNSSLTINGKFEFDLFHCLISRPNIIFNSLAMSRWEYTTDLGWGSSHTITGTGVSNLHIYYSIFGCSSPTGLARDAYNSWNSILDN